MDARDESSPPGASGPRLRTLLLALIVLLYLLSVPWYRDPEAPLRLWLGLPDWVTTALLCYLAVAVLNAWAWTITHVTDPDPDPAPASAPGASGDRDEAAPS